MINLFLIIQDTTPIYLIITVITFILSTLFAVAGFGSASTLVPIYISLGLPTYIAITSGLMLNIFTLSSATVSNAKRHYISWKLGAVILIPAVIMAPIGAIVSIRSPREVLLLIFAIFLIYSIYNLFKKRNINNSNNTTSKSHIFIGILVGGLAGFLGGLLGIGGGLIIFPALAWLETDIKKIGGTIGYIVLFTSFSGLLSYVTLLKEIDFSLLIIIAITGAIGGFIGSFLMHKLESRIVRILVAIVIAYVVIRIILEVAKYI
ncbi:sulfite exporter TauE/SafE family protein [Acidianus sp. RZ1]|uniref:sulfite exporter TauE/SafE family protein n=1 Tax=Acidianus sp. RZ1 TaxID=1540082 RepID=UPI0014921486|nr:sulfite exporter TauE/SafE family protein [Acidianus sp. RZ1]NON62583.1 sulfite exporter TauE/SafE family protein [Acidianus sp. RZ1]